MGDLQAALARRVCEIEEDFVFSFAVPRGLERRRSRQGTVTGKGKETAQETVEEYLGRIVPEHKRVRACWRVSLALPERLGGVVRYARVLERGSVRGWMRERAAGGEGVTESGGRGGGEEGVEGQEEMHLEVWAERVPEFEMVDGAEGGKVWSTVRRAEGWNDWVDPKAWRLLPFEII